MSRLKTTIQAALIAVVLLLAAGTPASARTAAGREQPQLVKYENHKLPALWRWMIKKLSRYAMAAN